MAGFDDNQPLRGPEFEPPVINNREELLENESGPATTLSANASEKKQIGLYQPSAPQVSSQKGGHQKISANFRNKIVASVTAVVIGIGGAIGLGS